MKRIAQLIRTAGEIRRSIWASLPFRERFAEILCKLASSVNDAFGTGMYGIFLENGVEGMPPIHGKPASEWMAKYPGASATKLINHLPAAYGREFGGKAFRAMMRKYHNPTIVEDLMSGLLEKFLKKEESGGYLKPGTPLQRAEAYVIWSLTTQGINLLRRKRFEVGESTLRHPGDDEKEPGFLERAPMPEPEESEEEQEENFSALLTKFRPQLRRIHPAAEQYLRLIADGYSDVEILGNPGQGRPSMLDHPYNKNGGPLTPTAWIRFKKQIKDLIYPALKGRPDALPL